MSYGNIRRSNVRQTMVPLDAVREIVNQLNNPPESQTPLVQADGGAYRAYCFNISNKHK